MEYMLWRRVRFAGGFAEGKCTSILVSRFSEDGCKDPIGVGVAELLVRGVVYPLPKEGVAEVDMVVDESEVTLGALRRAPGRFAEPISPKGDSDAADGILLAKGAET
jgi:hypothetical protein